MRDIAHLDRISAVRSISVRDVLIVAYAVKFLGAFWMRTIYAVLAFCILIAPALGQSQNKAPPGPPPPPPKSQQEIQAEKTAQDAYENSLRNIPDKPPADPWGTARSLDAPKVATKSGAKRTKTGSDPN
jgi:hypothetical protein